MRFTPDSRWGTWLAAFVAYLTAFQLVFAGLAPVGHAAAGDPGAGTIGAAQVICAQALGVGKDAGGSGRHNVPHSSPDCCLFGCTLGGLLIPPGGAALPGRALAGRRIGVVRLVHDPDTRLDYSPQTIRGPPGIV